MSNTSDKTWAYIHDELAPDEKIKFEQALENNPVLRESLNERLATDTMLKESIPQLESNDGNNNELVDQLLAEWEEEHPEFREQPTYSRGKILQYSLPLAAAAAAAFVLLALPGNKGPIHWQRTAYGTSPHLRGDSGTSPYYLRSDLKKITRTLQESIESDLLRVTETPERWILKIHMQELAKGSLAIEVSGHSENQPERSKVWNTSSQGLEHLRTEIPTFTGQIAEDIAGKDSR